MYTIQTKPLAIERWNPCQVILFRRVADRHRGCAIGPIGQIHANRPDIRHRKDGDVSNQIDEMRPRRYSSLVARIPDQDRIISLVGLKGDLGRRQKGGNLPTSWCASISPMRSTSQDHFCSSESLVSDATSVAASRAPVNRSNASSSASDNRSSSNPPAMCWISASWSPACTILSPYFFGTSFDINHLFVSIRTRRSLGSLSRSSLMATRSSAHASTLDCLTCAYNAANPSRSFAHPIAW